MRIAIVNDSVMALEALRRVVLSEPGAQLAWTAADGAIALRQCLLDRPDLILMDIFMPVMDGVEASRCIMRDCPCPILIVTANVAAAPTETFEALAAGALDVVATPVMGHGSGSDIGTGADALRRKIRQIAYISGAAALEPWRATQALPLVSAAPAEALLRTLAPLLLVGASTGGPAVVLQLLRDLPRPLPFACVIIQHINVEFAKGMAHWLSGESGQSVELARSGDIPQAGIAYVSGEAGHLVFDRAGRLVYRLEPVGYPYQPSINECFFSAAGLARTGIAIQMTGMGRDGALGMAELRRKGWHTIAQDPATCAVRSMPQSAMDAGGAQSVLPPQAMVAALIDHLSKVEKS